MTRRSTVEKADTHERILRYASEAFRAHGSTVGIGEVMKELGLTRGGFYRHFDSKDDLLIQAVALGLREIADRLEQIAQQAEKGKELEAIITAYLSLEHLLHPESWCALAALAPDIARQSLAVRQRLDGTMQVYLDKMIPYMPGANEQERRTQFFMLFSGMAGAIAMLRALGDTAMRDQVLALTRDYYIKAFAGRSAAGE